MILKVKERAYDCRYFPFYLKEQHEDFHIWGMRLPSGRLEEVIVFEMETPLKCLQEYSEYLINEYVLEDDIVLTSRAIEFKKELCDLFYELEEQ